MLNISFEEKYQLYIKLENNFSQGIRELKQIVPEPTVNDLVQIYEIANYNQQEEDGRTNDIQIRS